MAQLLQTDAAGLNEMAPAMIISIRLLRAAEFCQSDLQPLLNEGAAKEDLAASVLQAVVNQTIAGLAQGRVIRGNVVFRRSFIFFIRAACGF